MLFDTLSKKIQCASKISYKTVRWLKVWFISHFDKNVCLGHSSIMRYFTLSNFWNFLFFSRVFPGSLKIYECRVYSSHWQSYKTAFRCISLISALEFSDRGMRQFVPRICASLVLLVSKRAQGYNVVLFMLCNILGCYKRHFEMKSGKTHWNQYAYTGQLGVYVECF